MPWVGLPPYQPWRKAQGPKTTGLQQALLQPGGASVPRSVSRGGFPEGWPGEGPRVAEGARRRRLARRRARSDRRHRGPPRRRAAPRSSYQRVCTRPRLGKALAARPRGAGWLARWEVGARGLRRGPHRPRGGRPSGCRDCRRGRPPLFGLGTVGEVWVLLPLAARCPSRGAAGTPRFGRRGQAPPSLL